MEEEMKILGIDPGLQVCGYACLRTDSAGDELVEGGVFRTTTSAEMEVRLNQIAQDLSAILEKFKPDYAAVEELYSHYKHPRTSILMGHARGVILQKCGEFGVEVKSFSATRIKKSLTNNGRASKEQMQQSVKFVLSLDKVPEPHDVADAIAIALCCANSLNAAKMILGS
ncbi:MAG: crossover junction endodeoxyribonuclease RuvC [Planctomycetes bacterium]|nr:crossover junction endodeoxyribonuclease RuvC [Planctomycetota bacterium]